MKYIYILLGMFIYVSLPAQMRFYKYPAITPSDEVVSSFGVTYTNPYCKLNDINANTTLDWLDAQKKMIDQYRRSVYPQYSICERMLFNSILDYPTKHAPHKKKAIYFSERYSDDHSPIIYYKRKYNYEYQQLCGLGIFQTDDFDKIFVRHIVASHDAKYAAIVFSHSGSDWMEVRVRDIDGQTFLPDKLDWVKFNTVIWNDEGFYYTRYDAPPKDKELAAANKNQRIMYHKLGTTQDKDQVLFSAEGKNLGIIYLNPLDSDKIVIVGYTRKQKNKTYDIVGYFKPDSMQNGIKEFITVPYDGTDQFDVIGTQDNRFLVKSTFKAANGQLMLYDADKINSATVLIEQFNQPLRFANNLKDRIFCIYYDMGKFRPVVFDTTGRALKKLEIPDGYAIDGFHYTVDDTTTVYTLSSFEGWPRTVQFDFKNLTTEVYDDEAMLQLLHSGYHSKIVYYPSKDSALIPMYVVYKQSTVPDSTTPLLLYAYGGFGHSMDPHYDPGFNLFMNMGGILAVPLIRGGGELGETWHRAGMLLNKQKSFDDFISAAEYLIQNKYTSPEKLAINGGSNGGLLVGAAMVQRPDLFKVVVPEAAVLDLINFSKYSSGAQVGNREYGDPADSVQFLNLCKLSPLHHLKPDVEYPACMLITSDHDDRVLPSHSYRFAAYLQNKTKQRGNPYFLYVAPNQGHAFEGTNDDFDELALMYTFIFINLGVEVNRAH